MTESATVRSLLAAFRLLAPWSYDRSYSMEDWERYIDAAQLVQESDPADVERAVAQLMEQSEGFNNVENETRLFLLLRIVFELPEHAQASKRRVFKGWVNWPEPDSRGYVNLSWPVGWRDNRPYLLARYEGAEGPRYAAIEEYRYLLANFPFRKLSDRKRL